MCYGVIETACAVSDRHAYSCLHHRESGHTVRSICSFVHCAMATLIEGEFVDDGTLPKRVVLSKEVQIETVDARGVNLENETHYLGLVGSVLVTIERLLTSSRRVVRIPAQAVSNGSVMQT